MAFIANAPGPGRVLFLASRDEPQKIAGEPSQLVDAGFAQRILFVAARIDQPVDAMKIFVGFPAAASFRFAGAANVVTLHCAAGVAAA